MSLIFPSIRLRHVGWVSTNKLIIVTMFNPMFNPVRLLTQITNKRKTCTCRFHFFRCEKKCLFSKFSFSWKSSKNMNTSPRSLLILLTWALLWFRQFCSQIIEMKEVCFLCEEPATATCQRCCRVRCWTEESGMILKLFKTFCVQLLQWPTSGSARGRGPVSALPGDQQGGGGQVRGGH